MILRYAGVLFCLSLVQCQTNIDDLDSIFNAISPESDSVQSPKCQQIEGKLKGCHECYPCNHSIIATHRSNGNTIQTLTLNNKDCVAVVVCCVNQLSISTRIGSPCATPCGIRNPEGAGARQSREGVRSVLDGEYPWAGYLYKKVGSRWEFACGATYIQEKNNAFVTSAECVQGLTANKMAIQFYQTPPRAANVARVIVHEEYDAAKGVNNIALLTLNSYDEIPEWGLPACLPVKPPVHATSCLTLEENNNIINVVIPKRKVCNVSSPSQTCAVAPPDDYQPQRGSGLVCEMECENRQVFVVQGVASSQTADDITTYAEVFHFHNWIDRYIK